MRQMRTTSHNSALLILGGLIFFVVLGIAWKFFIADLELIAYVAGCSTLAVALLTVAYVLTTNNQLYIMRSQLEEMRKNRESQAQPLPVVADLEVSIERPRFFYTPPEDSYSAHSRSFGKFRVRNEGSHPAINLVLTGTLRVPVSADQKAFGSISRLVEVIGEKAEYPPITGTFDDFMFSNGGSELIAAIREKDLRNPPFLRIRSMFQNTLGACYVGTSIFMLYLQKTEDDNILNDWHANLAAFSIRYKTELSQLTKVRTNGPEWHAIFDSVKERFKAELGGPDKLVLASVAVPMSFKVEALSPEEFKSELSKSGFGAPTPAWLEDCLHIDAEVI